MKFNEFISQVALPKVQNVGSSGSNSVHRDWPDLGVDDIEDWNEFDSRTFAYLYESLWKTSIDCPSPITPPNSMTFITGEDSIEKLLAAIFQVSIGKLFEDIQSKLGRLIWLGTGSLCDLGTSVSQSNSPDWTCALATDNKLIRAKCYCAGDTKSGNKFNPGNLGSQVSQDAERNMPPIRQVAHYARLSKSRYGFIVDERRISVMRIAFEEINATQGSRRSAPYRVAAPQPGALRFSGQSGQSVLSEAISRMSIDSFAPEEATRVEMATFPWAEKKRGLSGFGAWIMLLIIATEPEEYGTGRSHAPFYQPLHAMVVNRKPAEYKSGKKVHSAKTFYTSLLNGKTFNHAPDFVHKIEPQSEEDQEGYDNE